MFLNPHRVSFSEVTCVYERHERFANIAWVEIRCRLTKRPLLWVRGAESWRWWVCLFGWAWGTESVRDHGNSRKRRLCCEFEVECRKWPCWTDNPRILAWNKRLGQLFREREMAIWSIESDQPNHSSSRMNEMVGVTRSDRSDRLTDLTDHRSVTMISLI